MVMVYYSKRIPSKISKGKMDIQGKSRGNQVQASKNSLPMESHGTFLILLARSCDSMCEMLPTRKAHSVPVFFIETLSHRESLFSKYQISDFRNKADVQQKLTAYMFSPGTMSDFY